MTRSLQAILLALLATLALGVAACGGGGGDAASEDTDVDTLLSDTFSGKDKKIESGKLAVKLDVDAKGAEGVNGPITLSVGGPFQSQGAKKLPKFDIDFAFEGAGQSIKAGLTSTGTKGFVNFQGTEYEVSDQVFQQFKAGYEQAQKNGTSKSQQQSLSSLGLDPRQWLTNPKNEGDAKVGDDDTIKITGGVDVNKLLDDVNTALSKVKQLGAQGTQNLPSQLTAEQRKQVTDAIKNPKVEIYTGKEDKILRRMVVSLGIVDPKGSAGSATVNFDLSISDLNEDQEISEPSGAKPFDQLLSKFGGLGGLGSTGGTSGSSGGGTSGSGSNEKLEKYSKCVTDAGSDVAKARECQKLLTG